MYVSRLAMIFLLSVVMNVESAHGQINEVLRYRLSGNWTAIADGTGTGPEGWGLNPNNGTPPAGGFGSGLPGPNSEARVNFGGNIVTVDSEVPTFGRLLIGVDENGIVDVEDGGVLTSEEDMVVGNNGFIEAEMNIRNGATVNVGRISWVARGPVVGDVLGFLNIDSGAELNVASHLWWGSTGDAFVNIDGTLNQTGGILGLGTSDFNTFGGSATVNVRDGGELNLNNIFGGRDGNDEVILNSIQPGSSINITGSGRVTLPGDFNDVAQAYVDADRILANGSSANVIITLENSGAAGGDYNNDGIVDAADYTIWRDNLGGDSVALNGNGTGAPTVVTADYDLWKANFGQTSSLMTVITAATSGTGSAVPEPTSGALFGILAGLLPVVGTRIRT